MDQEPLKIEIPVEEEAPLKVEQPRSDVKSAATDASRKAASTAKDAASTVASKAWNSDARRAVSSKVTEVTDKGVRYVGTRIADSAEAQTRQRVSAVQDRVKETDWEKEAKDGVTTGLKWLSNRLADLATRITPTEEKKPPQE